MARVLAVDDEAPILALTKRILEHAGHEVIEATGGEAALRMLGETEIDLLITDLVMPGLDGLELIRLVRQRLPHLPIIAVSGGERMGPGTLLGPAGHLGANRTLAKPFSRQDLMTAVDELLGARD